MSPLVGGTIFGGTYETRTGGTQPKQASTLMATGIGDMVAAAKSRIEELTIEQLQAEIESGDVTVVDIRDVRERWERGTVPGAVSAPRGMLEFWFAPDSPYYRDTYKADDRYVLYCAGGHRSALATDVLQDLGYTNVAHLIVGYNGWKEADGATEDVHPNPKYFQGS